MMAPGFWMRSRPCEYPDHFSDLHHFFSCPFFPTRNKRLYPQLSIPFGSIKLYETLCRAKNLAALPRSGVFFLFLNRHYIIFSFPALSSFVKPFYTSMLLMWGGEKTRLKISVPLKRSLISSSPIKPWAFFTQNEQMHSQQKPHVYSRQTSSGTYIKKNSEY